MFLLRQCVQENLATDVHNTFRFDQAPSHSRGGVTCQEDNTMAEGEKHGVGGQTCTATLPYQVCRMSYEQNNKI